MAPPTVPLTLDEICEHNHRWAELDWFERCLVELLRLRRLHLHTSAELLQVEDAFNQIYNRLRLDGRYQTMQLAARRCGRWR